MRCPRNADKFHELVNLIIQTLSDGKTVHIGCIGGHGRTGLVIAAVVAELHLGEEGFNCVEWVRQHYCKKAVESQEQLNFLHAYYNLPLEGLTKPSKAPYSSVTTTDTWSL